MFTRLIMCHKSKFIDAGNIEMIFISSIATVILSHSISQIRSLDFNVQFQILLYYIFVFGPFSLFPLAKGLWEMKMKSNNKKLFENMFSTDSKYEPQMN